MSLLLKMWHRVPMNFHFHSMLLYLSQKATVTLVPAWHFGNPHFPCSELQKLDYDKITYAYCVINEFNPTFEVQNMGNKAFQNALF